MITAGTTQWIRWHAALEDRRARVGTVSIAECLGTDSVSRENLGKAVSDLLEALAQLNVELNGDVPSENIAANEAVPRAIAYAVAEIDRMLTEATDRGRDESSEASLSAWQLRTAWLAILAGDVDDLLGHLANEAAMRQR
jgi:hypothetical protein